MTWVRAVSAIFAVSALVQAAGIGRTAAQSVVPVPNFASSQYGWVRTGRSQDYERVPGTIPPIGNDPAHRFVGNGTGEQTVYRISDVNNPNLKPWARERMKKDNDEVLAGKIGFTARQSCLPAGVPAFMAYGGDNPVFFIQTAKQVWMNYSGDQQIRRIYMDVPHSMNPKPSWYGESIGHYEGDALVIDTIAQDTRTVLDPYRTPHSEKLHVIERLRTTNLGQTLEATFVVEDSDAFYQPWSGMRRYRRVQEPWGEEVCAENNQHFDYQIPVAAKPDF
jgi:hypothetical protein